MSAVSKTETGGTDLVFGLGATGLSIARYLRRNEGDAIFVDSRDEPPGVEALRELWPDAEVRLGDIKLSKNIDRVLVSPGIPDSDKLLKRARKKKLEILSDIELFARDAQAPFVAVTGSNGKSTLIYHMCRAAGMNVLAGGNLGEPALDLLDEEQPELYVLELSSFQLQRTDTLPAEVAVLLNVSPDHLDWHASEDEYRQAKYRIYREARAAVVNRADEAAAEHARDIDKVITFGLDAPDDGQYGLRIDDGRVFLARGDTLLIATDEIALVGTHNHANALAAMAAAELVGVEMASMLQVLGEFPGLPHRMQRVARKGGDFSELAGALEDRLRAAVLIGKDAEAIADALDTVMPVYFAQDMDDAVCKAAAYAEPDDTVLLAPACASLDQYANYGARGDAFCQAVEALAR